MNSTPISSHQCAQCGNTENLKLCTRCQAIRYCSIGCQKLAWETHKAFCNGQKDILQAVKITAQIKDREQELIKSATRDQQTLTALLADRSLSPLEKTTRSMEICTRIVETQKQLQQISDQTATAVANACRRNPKLKSLSDRTKSFAAQDKATAAIMANALAEVKK